LFRCYKCIDLTVFNSEPTSRPEQRVLFAGGNFQRKGLATLIRAAAVLLRDLPDLRFEVVGRDTNQPALLSLARRVGVAHAFDFRGAISNEDLRNAYRRAAVFALPSLVEAFGVAILEAMASGTPVVATRVGGIPELVEHGVNGLLVEPDDPGQLAEALRQILTESKLAEALVVAGAGTALRFGVDQMMQCTYGVYARVLGSSA
jgi:glycosyltransferase involved in cell wall biosynthesis